MRLDFIAYITGLVGILILIFMMIFCVLKGKKIFSILNIAVLFISLVLIIFGIGTEVINKKDLSQQKVTTTAQNSLLHKADFSEDVTKVDINTLVEPKTDTEEALALGFYHFENEQVLNKLKSNQGKGYPKFGDIKSQLDIEKISFLEFGMSKSLLKSRKGIYQGSQSNNLFCLNDKLLNYDCDTTYQFDESNKLVTSTSKFQYMENYDDEFKSIRASLIKYFGEPTFENAFLARKDKFDESQDKNVTYVVGWDSQKRYVMLEYTKMAKDITKSKIELMYGLR